MMSPTLVFCSLCFRCSSSGGLGLGFGEPGARPTADTRQTVLGARRSAPQHPLLPQPSASQAPAPAAAGTAVAAESSRHFLGCGEETRVLPEGPSRPGLRPGARGRCEHGWGWGLETEPPVPGSVGGLCAGRCGQVGHLSKLRLRASAGPLRPWARTSRPAGGRDSRTIRAGGFFCPDHQPPGKPNIPPRDLGTSRPA